MQTALEAIQHYFEERNRAWVTGDARPLTGLSRRVDNQAWYHRFCGQLAAKRREMQMRGGRLLRAHSRIVIRKVTREADGKGVIIHLDEKVTWVFRDAADFSVESRIIVHRQRWMEEAGRWLLAWDVESSEGTENALHATLSRAPDAANRFLRGPGGAADRYHRIRVLRYAELWWDGFNPSFTVFTDDDCTNFVSQCLLAGNVRMTDGGDRAVGWWYRFSNKARSAEWSYSWSTANALALWLINRLGAQVISEAKGLKIGDVIFYDWQGTGKYGHSAVVVDFNTAGDPLVNAHSDASFHRHYLYLDSRAWTPATRYLFVHIPDMLA